MRWEAGLVGDDGDGGRMATRKEEGGRGNKGCEKNGARFGEKRGSDHGSLIMEEVCDGSGSGETASPVSPWPKSIDGPWL